MDALAEDSSRVNCLCHFADFEQKWETKSRKAGMDGVYWTKHCPAKVKNSYRMQNSLRQVFVN